MEGKKRIITFEDLKSIWSCNQISDNIELLASELRETLQDHQNDCICLNKFIFKVGVQVPFEFSITDLLYVFGTTPIHLTPNSWKIIQTIVWFCEWRRCSTNHHFWRFLLSRKVIQGLVTFTGKHKNKVVNNHPHSRGRGVVLILGVPDWWRERLPDLMETASVELEMSQRVVLEFFHSHRLEWFSSKEIFFRWCQGFTFFGALVAFERGEADVCEEGRHRKKRRLKRAIRKGQGPVMLQEDEEERLARREEVDLHAALALSREEAHCSSLAVSLAEPANSRPAELFLGEGLLSESSGRQRAATVRGFPTSQHKGYDKASRRPRGIENSSRNMAATPTPVGCGVLAATLGETSLATSSLSRHGSVGSEGGSLAVMSRGDRGGQKLLTELDATKAERDEALDHAKGVILAKKLQQRLPVCAYRSLTPRLPSADCPTKWLLFKAKRATRASRRQSCWRSLRSQLEAPQAEPAQLRADLSEGAEGDASSQASGPLSGESRALIISRYLRSDAHRQRVEFEHTHYAHGGFVKALLEDATLYPKLDLSSLYGSS
ncbi:hypothetical protein ACLOJK_023439 [Asimina triloba]